MSHLMLASATLIVFLALAGCAAERASSDVASSGTSAPRVALPDLLDGASQRRADGTLAALGRLPEPRRVEAEPVENRHDPAQTDTIRTYHYGGVAVEVYTVADGKELLQEIRVTERGYETAEGLGVGSTRDAVREALGNPTRSGGDGLVYERADSPDDPTPTTLTIRFEGDRVAALAWSYYVD